MCWHNSENMGSGQQCCYFENGSIIVGPPGGGTVDRYADRLDRWNHFLYDVLPYFACCVGLFSDCQAYYDKRPSDDGSNYDRNPPGRFIFNYMRTKID